MPAGSHYLGKTMAPKQTVGLRKQNTGVRKRGKERREQLIQAAYDLLCEYPVEEIAFIDIAKKASIPEGSAYHFFSNKYDVFAALARELSDKFVEMQARPYRKKQILTWQNIVEQMVMRGARLYHEHPPAMQLFIGGKTPPEIKMLDRHNDRNVAAAIEKTFSDHFHLPDPPENRDMFYILIEIVDLIFSLSILEHGELTDSMIEEAKRTGKAYLGIYLPEQLEARRK